MKDFDLRKYLTENKLVKEELEEIDMTISSEAVEFSVKQGLNQMFERLADIVDNKKEASIQSETLGVTNYIKRLMREYAKYADMDRRDSIEGGNKFSKQGKEEARQEIERILSLTENKLVKENRALYDKVVGNNFERGNKEMSFDYERDMVHKVIDGVRNDFSNDEMLTREYINTIIAALEELKVNDF